jgi:hypothetical protein
MIAELCNPTGIMVGEWRAPSEHRAPYPPRLPVEERAIWDLKSEAEVMLAHKVKTLNETTNYGLGPRDDQGHWTEWWQRQALRVDEIWDNSDRAEPPEQRERYHAHQREIRQELIDEQLKGVRAREQAARDRAEANERRARMIGL